MSELTARLVTLAAELEALEPDWWALWRRCPDATPFTAPAWLLPWWQAFHPGHLHAVAVRAGGRLVGLAPLYLEDGPYGRRLLPLGIGVSDHFDLLLDPDHEADAGAALLAELAASPDWEVISLEELPPDAAALRLAAPGWRDERRPQSACPVLTLSGRLDPDGLPLDLSQKRRQNIRRARRAAPDARIETATNAAAFLAGLSSLHAARWQERDATAGVLADPAVQRFQAAALPALMAAGLARCRTVHLGGSLAGLAYNLVWMDDIAFYLSGFAPALAKTSPLTLLLADTLAAAAAAGVRRFSFLRGREPYKYLWGAEDRWNQARLLARP